MAIVLIDNFKINKNAPIDSRMVVDTIADRDAIPETNRYKGLGVYVTSEKKLFKLVEGTSNEDWMSEVALPEPTYDELNGHRYLKQMNLSLQSARVFELGNYPYINVLAGYRAGESLTDQADGNIFIGKEAGLKSKGVVDNVFIGRGAGVSNEEGNGNVFIGRRAGEKTRSVLDNICIGREAGGDREQGNDNIYLGFWAGKANNGSSNVMIGNIAGGDNAQGASNVYVGTNAGKKTVGSSNTVMGNNAGASFNGNNCTIIGSEAAKESESNNSVFIGIHAGSGEKKDNRLHINNSETAKPLIYGEFDNKKVIVNGNCEFTDFMKLWPQSSAPRNPSAGTVYFDNGSKKLKLFNGTDWETINSN